MKNPRIPLLWLVLGCLLALLVIFAFRKDPIEPARPLATSAESAPETPSPPPATPDPVPEPAETEQAATATAAHADEPSFPDPRLADRVPPHTPPPDATNTFTDAVLVESDLKYPRLRVEREWGVDPGTGATELRNELAMAADHLLVQLKPDATEEDLLRIAERSDATIRKRMSAPGLYLVAFTADHADALPEKKRAFLRHTTVVAFAEPDYVVHTQQTEPNDPRFPDLWGLHNTGQTGGTPGADIHALDAWSVGSGMGQVVVAVLDTGIDYTHEDLAENIWVNPLEIPGNNFDDDGNGYVDDIRGWNFFGGNNDPFDDNRHGSHVAGTVAAVGDNAIGVVGVNWRAQLMPLKFLGPSGSGFNSDAIEALYYVVGLKQRGIPIRVTCNSWGGGAFSEAMQAAIQANADEDILFVAAAGNQGRNTDNTPHYPASYPVDNIISVAATTHNDGLASFSNRGAETVALGAPGVRILSTVPGNGYAEFSGTSMATPHVAGAAALIFDLNPSATYAEVRDILLETVDPLPALADVTLSGGRLNAYTAMLQLGMLVQASEPARNEIVQEPPTEFVFTFSAAFDPDSVSTNALVVNDLLPSTVEEVDEETLRFVFDSSPVVAQGLQTMQVPADSIARLSDGDGVVGWSGTFRYDALPMEVVATEPPIGAIATLPLTEILLHFNEPFDPEALQTGSILIEPGQVVDATPLNATSAVFAVEGLVLETELTLNLPAGALHDEFGNPNRSFSTTWLLDVGVVEVPDPFLPVAPAGGLLYTGQVHATIHDAEDVDRFELRLDEAQRLSIRLSPEPQLRPSLHLLDPDGGLVAFSAAAQPGATAQIDRAIITTPGLYTIRVASLSGTAGAYELDLVLNGFRVSEPPAAPLNLDLLVGPIAPGVEHLTLVGQLGADAGPVLYATDFNNGADDFAFPSPDSVPGPGLWHASTGRSEDGLPGHSPPGSLYYGQNEGPEGGGDYDTEEPNRGRVFTPFFTIPEGHTAQLRFQHFLETEDNPLSDIATVGYTVHESVDTATFLPLASSLTGELPTGTGGEWQSVAISLADLAPGDYRIGFDFDTVDNRFNFFEGWYIDDLEIVTFVPVRDRYIFSLGSGQGATLAVAATDENPVTLRLFQGDDLLAVGAEAEEGIQTIRAVRAPMPRSYVVEVEGMDASYSLVLLKEATLGTRPGGHPDAILHLDANATVLGHSGRSAPMPMVDSGLASASGRYEGRPEFGLPPATPGPGAAVGFNGLDAFAVVPGDSLPLLSSLSLSFWLWIDTVQSDWMCVLSRAEGIGPSWSFWVEEGSGTERRVQWAGQNWSPMVEDVQLPVQEWRHIVVTHDTAAGLARIYTNGQLAAESAAGSLPFADPPDADLQLAAFQNDFLFAGRLDDVILYNRALSSGEAALLYHIGAGGVTVSGPIARYRLDERPATRYLLPVQAGDMLQLATHLPAAGPGAFRNEWDPALRLLDPTGVEVAFDANSAPDGTNALLLHHAAASGDYRLHVEAQDQRTGEYRLDLQGATPTAAPFRLVSSEPADGEARNALNTVSLRFSGNLLRPSLVADGFLLNGDALTATFCVDGETLLLDLPPLDEGTHQLEIQSGAIANVSGTPVEGTTLSFEVDRTAPRVAAISPQHMEEVPAGPLTVEIAFTKPLNVVNLSRHSIRLRGDRSGPIAPASIVYDSDTDTLTAHYATLPTEDIFTLRLPSGPGEFEDALGNALDGELIAFPIPPNVSGDGVPGGDFVMQFFTDSDSLAFPVPLRALPPVGSMVHSGIVTGLFSSATNEDAYTLPLAPGNSATLLLRPPAGSLASLSIEGPGLPASLSVTGATEGAAVLLPHAPVQAGGVYTARVASIDGPIGTYTLSFYLNAGLEEESYGDESNNTAQTAQPLDAAFSALTSNAAHAAIVGVLDGSDDEDWYALDADIGETYSIALSPHQPDATLRLEWFDETGGMLRGLGVNATRAMQVLPDIRTNLNHSWRFRVTGDPGGYTLLVLRNALFDAGPLLHGDIPELGNVDTVLGGVDGSHAILDRTVDPLRGRTMPPVQLARPGAHPQTGRALGFGGNGRVLFSNTPHLDSPHFTVAFWAKAEPRFGLVPIRHLVTLPGRYQFSVGNDNIWRLHLHGIGFFDGPTVVNGAWHHFAFTLDGDSRVGRLYVDGQLAQQRIGPTATPPRMASAPLYFGEGAFAGTAATENRTLDDVQFYNVALDPEEILYLYEHPGQIVPSPVAHFDLDDRGDHRFRLALDPDTELTAETATPSDAPGEFGNPLNPGLRLFDADDIVLLTDTNSAPDGKNARIEYTADPAGTNLTLGVTAISTGVFRLALSGPSDIARFFVHRSEPQHGDVLYHAPTHARIEWNRPVLILSVQPTDLKVNQHPATAVTFLDGQTALFTLPPLLPGELEFAIEGGAIFDVRGLPIEPFSATFEYISPEADLAISVTSTPAVVQAGCSLNHLVTIVNHGPHPAFDVSLAHLASGPFEVTDVLSTRGLSTPDDPVVARIPRLLPGRTAEIRIIGRIDYPGDIVSVFAAATSSHDPNPANHSTFLLHTAEEAAPAQAFPVFGRRASPEIFDPPPPGQLNHPGEAFDFDLSGGGAVTLNACGFGDFGTLYINYDATNLYIGATGCRIDGDNDAMVIFLGVSTLDYNAFSLIPRSGFPAGLDHMHNLFFNTPMDIAILLGHEGGDFTDFAFELDGGEPFGQGLFYLGANSFPIVPDTRLAQFDGGGTAPTLSDNDDGNTRTDRWEAAIPWSSLNATSVHDILELRVCGVLTREAEGDVRYLSGNVLGLYAASPTLLDPENNHGFEDVWLTGLPFVLPATDLDRDGLPDEWEYRWFGSITGADPDADDDEDGMTNFEEYIADTDPTDPDSRFVILSVTNAAGMRIEVPSSAARLYRFLYTDDPVEEEWTPLGEEIPGEEPTTAFTDPDPVDSRIYRVEVRLPDPEP